MRASFCKTRRRRRSRRHTWINLSVSQSVSQFFFSAKLCCGGWIPLFFSILFIPFESDKRKMLLGLVRESVMQCFCHTCRAPIPPAGKSSLCFSFIYIFWLAWYKKKRINNTEKNSSKYFCFVCVVFFQSRISNILESPSPLSLSDPVWVSHPSCVALRC